jgi:hypothetical protein
VIITAPAWHSLGTLSGRSASEDAIDRRPANVGEPVQPVLAEAGLDGSAYSYVPVTGHGHPLNEPAARQPQGPCLARYYLPTQEEVLAIVEKWRPYRSLATSYLFSAAFESAEAPPVARLGSA